MSRIHTGSRRGSRCPSSAGREDTGGAFELPPCASVSRQESLGKIGCTHPREGAWPLRMRAYSPGGSVIPTLVLAPFLNKVSPWEGGEGSFIAGRDGPLRSLFGS